MYQFCVSACMSTFFSLHAINEVEEPKVKHNVMLFVLCYICGSYTLCFTLLV